MQACQQNEATPKIGKYNNLFLNAAKKSPTSVCLSFFLNLAAFRPSMILFGRDQTATPTPQAS